MAMAQQRHVACPCGSGLSHARCCGLDLGSLGAPEANRHLLPLEQRAVRAHQQRAPVAERLALDVLELAPGLIGALTVLYEIRKAENKPNAATALLRRIVTLAPNTLWATHEMVLTLLARGDVLEAERHARNGIRIAPDSAQSHYLMGLVMTEAFRPAVGEHHYERALQLAGRREPVVLLNYALCLKNQGKMQAARALYEEALGRDPKSLPGLLGFARLEEADRNLDAALALIDRAAEIAPDNANTKLLRATVLGRQKKAGEALAILDSMAGDDRKLGPGEWLEKGRLLDQMGRYDEAFAAFTAGKQRLREISGHAYLAGHAQQVAARLKGFFVSGRLRMLPVARTKADVPQPIFIVGFPRSGTTLLEQTLTAHPRISAGDELPIIHELTNLMPRMLDSPLAYPEALAELWMGDHRDDLDRLRDHYLHKAEQLGAVEPGAAWFTDKMPLNETHLGLIALLFPQSPILHLIRHPLDVVLSTFSNLLTHGHYCAYALETTAQHYALTMDLVEHYRTEVSMRYLPVRYEDIVDDQEDSVRRVLDFVGEEFDARCLAFHENTRYARTASYAQVSERLYATSRYRHLRYRAQFEPVMPILAPWIERLGYAA
jgi:tetratricopeptide (TPR) repeat protein